MKEKFEYEVSSGNVFADLGFENPEEMLAKAELSHQIYESIKKKKLSKAAAAKLLDIDQEKLSDLVIGRLLEEIAFETLFRFLNILGQSIDIHITFNKKAKKEPHINITLPAIKKKKTIVPKRNTLSNTISIQAKRRK